MVTLFGRDYGDGAIFLSVYLQRELVQAFQQLALLGKRLVSAGCANHRKPTFLPALSLRLNGESLKTVIVKLGVWAYAKSSFLLIPQGNDRALKTNRLVFIISVLDNLTSCLWGGWRGHLLYFVGQESFHLDWLHCPAKHRAANYCNHLHPPLF